MMKKKRLSVGLVALAVGIGTITLFQNCSSGSLPSNLSSTTTPSAVATAVVTPLIIYPAAYSVTVNSTLVITVSGGTPPYTLTPSSGRVTTDALTGYILTAPAAAGSVTIAVADSAGLSAVTSPSITVIAATTDTTVVPTPTTKSIYSWYSSGVQMHASVDNGTSFAPGFGAEQVQYKLLSTQVTGSVAFYRCAYDHPNSGVRMYFDTTRSDCEGWTTNATVLGYIYSGNGVANTSPLYRYSLPVMSGARDHYTSLSSSPPASGWTPDGTTMGYVPN